MSDMNQIASSLFKALTESDSKKPTPYDTKAEVLRTDGDTVWVKIPGGIDETPVQKTNNANPGDTVMVRVSGGRAWLLGNNTSPATDDTRANLAYQIGSEAGDTANMAINNASIAKMAADIAEVEAVRAKKAADNANDLLDDMETSALAAGTTLTQIYQDAADAQNSATVANSAAISARVSLGDIEKVLGTVTWIAEHGEMVITPDTVPIDSKFYYDANKVQTSPIVNPNLQEYYELSNEPWAQVTEENLIPDKLYFKQLGEDPYYYALVVLENDVNPLKEEWYELSNGEYIPTDDQVLVLDKRYFERQGTGTDDDPYEYTQITLEGDVNPSKEEWFELIEDQALYQISTDTTVQDDSLYFSLLPPYYELTLDTEVVDGKTYYSRSGSGTEQDPYIYTEVEPIGTENPMENEWYEYKENQYILITEYIPNPHMLGLFELNSIDEAVTQYVASHVSLDDYGLVIQTDKDALGNDVKSKVRIGGDGVQLINDAGKTIATFSEKITLGDTNGIHVTLSPGSEGPPKKLAELGFWKDADTEVAYINSETLMITNAEIITSLRIGDYMWQVQTGRISLVYNP